MVVLVAEDFARVVASTAADFARVVALTAADFAPYVVEDFVQIGPLAVFVVVAAALKIMEFVVETVGLLVNLV